MLDELQVNEALGGFASGGEAEIRQFAVLKSGESDAPDDFAIRDDSVTYGDGGAVRNYSDGRGRRYQNAEQKWRAHSHQKACPIEKKN
jgi:hypothetical protein